MRPSPHSAGRLPVGKAAGPAAQACSRNQVEQRQPAHPCGGSGRLAEADVELFALTVLKGGRRIEDTPENYACLACEVLSLCWHLYPNISLVLDRHFTSAAQVAPCQHVSSPQMADGGRPVCRSRGQSAQHPGPIG